MTLNDDESRIKLLNSPLEKERRKRESIMKLLEKQTALNEAIMEENEQFAKDQASLLRLLSQRDQEIKQAQDVKIKGKEIGTKTLFSVIRKFTYFKFMIKSMQKWKAIMQVKSDLRCKQESTSKILRIINRTHSERLRKFLRSWKTTINNWSSRDQLLRRIILNKEANLKRLSISKFRDN